MALSFINSHRHQWEMRLLSSSQKFLKFWYNFKQVNRKKTVRVCLIPHEAWSVRSAKIFVVIPFAPVYCLLKIILCAHESLTDFPFSQVGFPSQSYFALQIPWLQVITMPYKQLSWTAYHILYSLFMTISLVMSVLPDNVLLNTWIVSLTPRPKADISFVWYFIWLL